MLKNKQEMELSQMQTEIDRLKKEIEENGSEISVGANSFIQELNNGLGEDMLNTLKEDKNEGNKLKKFIYRLYNTLN